MIRHTELELHRRAQALFEAENPGRLWRQPTGVKPPLGQRYAEIVERQGYIARVRTDMQREGIQLEDETRAASTLAYKRATT